VDLELSTMEELLPRKRAWGASGETGFGGRRMCHYGE
jgi:hypothetical protein